MFYYENNIFVGYKPVSFILLPTFSYRYYPPLATGTRLSWIPQVAGPCVSKAKRRMTDVSSLGGEGVASLAFLSPIALEMWEAAMLGTLYYI